MKYRKTQFGFTLVEILVVIAIIGSLSSIVLVSLNSARTKGENSAMIQQVNEYITAINLAYRMNGEAYPSVPSVADCIGGTPCWKSAAGSSGNPDVARSNYLLCLANVSGGQCSYLGGSRTSIDSLGAFVGANHIASVIDIKPIQPPVTWTSGGNTWSMDSVIYTSSSDNFILIYPLVGEFTLHEECGVQDAKIWRSGASDAAYAGVTLCQYESR